MANSLKGDDAKLEGLSQKICQPVFETFLTIKKYGGYCMNKWLIDCKRVYHKVMVNYHLELYKDCLDPQLKQKLYEKAVAHQVKYSLS